MHNAVLMCVGEALGHLGNHVDDLLDRHALAVIEHVPQFAPLQEFHGYIGYFATLAHVINGDDIRMAQTPRCFCFLIKARFVFVLLIHCQTQIDGFDGNDTIDQWIDSLIDRAHGTLTKLTDNIVATQLANHNAYLWWY